jgi:hypothetical protein
VEEAKLSGFKNCPASNLPVSQDIGTLLLNLYPSLIIMTNVAMRTGFTDE